MISSRRRYFTNVRSADSLRATDDRALPALFELGDVRSRTEVMSRSSGSSCDIFLPVVGGDPRQVLRDVALVGAHGVRRDVAIELEVGEKRL